MRESSAMATQRKPVIVRKFSREWSAGYAGAGFNGDSPELEILDPAGRVVRLPWETVKWVCFVRDLTAEARDAAGPERLVRRHFTTRPRTPGLWLRLLLRDGEELEGLAANDRSLIEGAGLMLTPPDARSNTQRIYVPRQAIQSLTVVALIGAPAQRRPEKTQQPDLFADKPEES